MREILFKAKRLDNGEWVEGYYFSQVFHKGTIEEEWYHFIKPIGSESWEYIRVDGNTICQYTGLSDKNGNKIWENDIVALDSLDGFVVEYDNENARFIFNGEHKDEDYGHCGFHLYAQKEIEVIGNIFDNPELLH